MRKTDCEVAIDLIVIILVFSIAYANEIESEFIGAGLVDVNSIDRTVDCSSVSARRRSVAENRRCGCRVQTSCAGPVFSVG